MKVGFIVVQESAIIHCFHRFRVRAFAACESLGSDTSLCLPERFAAGLL